LDWDEHIWRRSVLGQPIGSGVLNDTLAVALDVLEDSDEDHPGVPELLFARDPGTLLPFWWPRYNFEEHRPWRDNEESQLVLLERIETQVAVRNLRLPLALDDRRKIAKALWFISSELRSRGFDTPD
jgi:hypothetical protein